MRKTLIFCVVVLIPAIFVAYTELSAREAPFPQDRYVKLKTMAPEGKCLEGNRLDPQSVLEGAAFMNDCSRESGQYWKAKPIPGEDGYFWLQTAFLEAQNKCLEGNRLSPDSVLGGGAFMNDCDRQTGQFWKMVPEKDGFFRLKTQFQGDGKCLEGNTLDPGAVLEGAAFLDDCQNVTGQLWKFEDAPL